MYTLLTGLWHQWTACNQYNILIVGRQRTGKTTLFHTLKQLTQSCIDDTLSTASYFRGGGSSNSHITKPTRDFIQYLESSITITKSYAPTIGLNSNKALVQEGVQFQLWDVGGQLKLRPMWPHYYLETHAIIFVHEYICTDNAENDEISYNDAKNELYSLLTEEALLGVPVAIVLSKVPSLAQAKQEQYNNTNTTSPIPNNTSFVSSSLQSISKHNNNDTNSSLITNPAQTHPHINIHNIAVRLGIYHLLDHAQHGLFDTSAIMGMTQDSTNNYNNNNIQNTNNSTLHLPYSNTNNSLYNYNGPTFSALASIIGGGDEEEHLGNNNPQYYANNTTSLPINSINLDLEDADVSSINSFNTLENQINHVNNFNLNHPNNNTNNRHGFLNVHQNTHKMRLFMFDRFPAQYNNSKTNNSINNTQNNNNNQPHQLFTNVSQIAELVQWLIDIVPTTERAGLHLTG